MNTLFKIVIKNFTRYKMPNKSSSKSSIISPKAFLPFLEANSKIINAFTIVFFLLLIPKIVSLSNEHYIELIFNKEGENQVLSDEYIGALPSKIFSNGKKILYMNSNKKVFIDSINETVKLEFKSSFSNFSYMFNNLTSITFINIYSMFAKQCNMSYMFANCYNLEYINYSTTIGDNSIRDLRGMFYNCSSLKSFSFSNLYMDYYDYYYNYGYTYYYYDINISYMFYNCKKLDSVLFDSNYIKYANDMKGMFYNCFSLTYLDLSKIQTRNYIDYALAFYNCNKLTSIYYNSFQVKDMKLMFYNCYSLYEINLNNINVYSNNFNMSRLFYNCSNLTNIYGTLQNFRISDASEMFFNCSSIQSASFYPYYTTNKINMTKMFYNCFNMKQITFDIYYNYRYGDDYYYFLPNGLHATFYNCSSLKSIYFYYFRTDQVQDISYMFYNCTNLILLSYHNTIFYNSITTNMRGTFQNCKSLLNLNLSLFYTPKAEIMWDMFKGCSGLSYLNLNKFNTERVTDMESMFEGCSSLISISLTSFNTQKVHYMNKMFKDCSKLETINFKYISSQSLGTMSQMFYNCKNLKYLNIYNLEENYFSISQMFVGASTNFTFCVKDYLKIPLIFNELYHIENTQMDCSRNCYGYNRFKIPKSKICCLNYEYNGTCYDKCPSKTRVEDEGINCKEFNCLPYYYNYEQNDCLNDSIIPEGYYINDTSLRTIDKCNETCKTCDSKTNCLSCVDDSPYLFFGKCLNSCDYGFYEDSGIYKCKCFVKECAECTEESIEEGLCLTCAEGYYIKSGDTTYKEGFKKCYKDPKNYYLDTKKLSYKKCYPSCDGCYGQGKEENHNCINCNSNFSVIIQSSDQHQSKNCYKKCDYYYYFDNNIYFCTEEPKCPNKYKYLIFELGQCVKSCNESDVYFKEFRKGCYKECPSEESREINPFLCKLVCPYERPFELVNEQICVSNCSIMERKDKLCITNYEGNRTIVQLQSLVQNNIIDDLGKSFNISLMKENETITIEEKDTYYEIISTKNKNKNNKTSSIDLGECENSLKEYYKIDKEESLIIFKIDAKIEGKTGPSTIYEVYYPLLDPYKLEKLDLTICEGNQVDISYHIDLENPDLYNKDNPYYHDICFPSSGKIDMILDDRQKQYSENNMSLCEENCDYVGYNTIDNTVDCRCEIKINIPLISEIIIDKNKLYKFMDIKNIANFNVLNCTNLLFSKRGLIVNIGFYIFIPTFIMYFICAIIFYKKEYDIIFKSINALFYAKNNLKFLKKKNKTNKPTTKEKKEVKFLESNGKFKEPGFLTVLKKKETIYQYKEKNSKIKRNNYLTEINKQKSTKRRLKNEIITENISEENSSENEDYKNKSDNINNNKDEIKSIKIKLNAPPLKQGSNNSKVFNNKKKNNIKTENKLTLKEEQRIKDIIKHNDRELNELKYKPALKLDHRTYGEYYISLLKTNHLLFKVANTGDYNSSIIKIFLCFYNFSLSYTINALFFNDDTMHTILLDEGKFNIIYQLPQIVYSAVITFVLNQILNILALSENAILDFKQEANRQEFKTKFENLKMILHCKFIFFFVISFLLLLVFWYYIACFCAVYKNTQYHLLKDSLISFGSSMLTPLAFYLIPGIFRRLGLKYKKRFVYEFSRILQIIF